MKLQKILRFTFIIIALAGFSLVTLGQSAPEKINYQAVARDDNGNVMSQATIDVYFTIMDSNSNSVYEEEHTGVTTNDYGLFSVAIGNGSTQSGTFANIDWGSGQHMVEVEVNSGNGYTSMGTSELNSVPYSLYAEKTGAWQSESGKVYNEDDKVFIGRSNQITSDEVFGIKSTSSGYGGMYIDTEPNGQPFYGYSVDGDNKSWTYYDGSTDKWHLFLGSSNKISVQADGNVGIGEQSPKAPLDISGGNWDLENSEGDLRIGGVDDQGVDNRLKVSMSTGGQGAGHARINAFGYAPQVRIGASANDILTVDSLGVGIRTDDNDHPREEEFHIVQDPNIGNEDAGLAFELGSDGSDPGDNWRIGINGDFGDFDFYYNDSIKAWVEESDGSWTTSSDRRLKEAIEKPEPVLNKVMNLSPRKFYYKSNRQRNHKSYGFIAQEVEETFPGFVSDRGDDMKGISYGKLSVVSIQAIQEQQEIIDNQKKQIEELQKELDEIKDALDEAGISIE